MAWLSRWRRSTTLAVLTASTLAASACGGDEPVQPPKTVTVAPSPVTPTTPTAAATGRAALVAPKDGSDVKECGVFSGTARVPVDTTLVLAVRNLDNDDPNRYFGPVLEYEYPQDLATWKGYQWFGSKDSSVGQSFRVEVLLVKLAVVEAEIRSAQQKNQEWAGPVNPPGATVAAHVTLNRVAGPGPSECY